MNGYVCFYRGKRIEVYAENLLEAKEKAVTEFKARKRHEVSVILAEIDGEEVIHTPDF
jgi:hypothetical protein